MAFGRSVRESIWIRRFNSPATKIVHYVGAPAKITLPDVAGFDFIGTDVGETFHLLPQSVNQDLLHLGFAGDGLDNSLDIYDPSAESKGRVSGSARWAKATLSDVRHVRPDGSSGDGDFSLWQSGIFGGANVFMSSYDDGVSDPNGNGLDVTDGITADDAIWIVGGSQSHFNVGFTDPGRYEVDLKLSAYFGGDGNNATPNTGGFSESDDITIYFSVESVGKLEFDADSYWADEDAGTASIDVVRVGGSDGRISVDYATADGTADSSDYTPVTGTIEFADGETLKTISVPILDDSVAEPNETFTIELSNAMPASIDGYLQTFEGATGGLLGSTTTATVTIRRATAVPFSLPQPAATDLNLSYKVAAADLTGDGLDDLLVVTTRDRDIAYAPSLGGGEFGDLRVIEPGASSLPIDTYTLDLDDDGDLDVLAVGTDMLQYYLNDGSGNFASPVTVASAGSFFAAVADDLDGDGDTDFAATDRSDGSVYLFRNSGDGTFVRELVGTGFDGLRGLTSLDADGDGDIDLIASADRTNKISMFVNDGAGNFADEVVLTTDVVGIRYLYSADLDADGNVDFISTAFASSELAWYRSGGDGTFEKHVVNADESGIIAAAIADIDGDGDPDLVSGAFRDSSVAWYANDGNGNFTDRMVISAIPGGGVLSVSAGDFDGDGNIDAVGGGTPTRSDSSVFLNLSGRFSNQVVAPEDGTYFDSEAIIFDVHFGIPIDVTGTPEVGLQVGDQTLFAEYISGSGTPTLRFRYVVGATDRDLDGIQFASTEVILPDGAAMTGPMGDEADRTLPATDMSGVLVNGSAPRVASITRLDPAATNADSVRFAITFSEPVTGVTTATVAAHAGDGLTGASVTGISGTGADYVVTVATGSGSGVLGLTDGSAGIADTEGNALVTPILGGEVYTLQRRQARRIDTYFTGGHADIAMIYGDNHWRFQAPGSSLDANEVLIVGGPDSRVTAPSGSEFGFLGATPDSDIYILPQSGAPETIPDLGITSNADPADAFAAYSNPDSRDDANAAWIEMQLLEMRGPEGGHFSLYNSGLEEPTVWMASSDGIDDSDSLFTPAGSHSHYNWAFTQPGVYEIDVFASGFLDANGNGTFDEGIDSYTESGITTLYFSIDPPGGPTPYTIAADPLPAVAVDDAYAITSGNVLRGNVLFNDILSVGVTTIVSEATGPDHGSLELNTDGTFTYTPGESFVGVDSFNYMLNDGITDTLAMVSITAAALPQGEVLSEGHADFLINYHDDEWEFAVLGDDDHGHDHGHDEGDDHDHDHDHEEGLHLDEVIIYGGANAAVNRPADAAFDFTGVGAGETLYVLPQSNLPELPFLGVNGEEIEADTFVGNEFSLQMVAVDGPASSRCGKPTGLGVPEVFFASGDGITVADGITLPEGAHSHYNWGFSESGTYSVTVQASGVLQDGMTPVDQRSGDADLHGR